MEVAFNITVSVFSEKEEVNVIDAKPIKFYAISNVVYLKHVLLLSI